MAISIRLNGISDVQGTLRGIGSNLQPRAILRLSQVAYDEAQRGAARHSKKGDLFASLYNRPIKGGREVGHDPQRAPHAVFVNLGTKPHVIRPKNKKALRWASGGKFFFAGKVKHPGYIGDAYLLNAATLAVREFSRIIDQTLKEAT